MHEQLLLLERDSGALQHFVAARREGELGFVPRDLERLLLDVNKAINGQDDG